MTRAQSPLAALDRAHRALLNAAIAIDEIECQSMPLQQQLHDEVHTAIKQALRNVLIWKHNTR